MHSFFVLIYAVVILSQAGNIIRFCEAAPLAIAFYRLFFAFVLIFPFAWKDLRFSLKRIDRRLWIRVSAMAIFFGLHFITWIMAVKMTRVANAATCISMTPIFVSIGAYYFLSEKISKGIIFAVLLGVIGVLFIGFDDLQISRDHLYGDFLAIISALFLSSYLLLGKVIRISLQNRSLMCLVYFISSAVLMFLVLMTNTPMMGYSTSTKFALIVLAIFPTILGHASMIYVMKDFSSSFVATVTLVEPVLAGIGAMYLFGEKITLSMGIGYTIIIVGLLMLIYNPAVMRKK